MNKEREKHLCASRHKNETWLLDDATFVSFEIYGKKIYIFIFIQTPRAPKKRETKKNYENMRVISTISVLLGVTTTVALTTQHESNIESDQICDEIEAEHAIIELHDDLDDDDDGTISTTG